MQTEEKVHVGVNINKKKTAKIRVTNHRRNKHGIITSLDLTIYQNHKPFCLTRMGPNQIRLTLIFLELQDLSNKKNIKKLQWPSNDFMFKICDINEFIKAGNMVLNSLQIYVTESEKLVISDKEKQDIMKKFHVDAATGEHCGQKKLFAKIRDEFYWRYMTFDIARFVKNCNVCMEAKESEK